MDDDFQDPVRPCSSKSKHSVLFSNAKRHCVIADKCKNAHISSPMASSNANNSLDSNPSYSRIEESSSVADIEDEDLHCTICKIEMTSAGEHRNAALPCGHIFGHSCILKWIWKKGKEASCPVCNRKVTEKQIIKLVVKKSVIARENGKILDLIQSLAAERKGKEALEVSNSRLNAVNQDFSQKIYHLELENAQLKQLIDRQCSALKRMGNDVFGGKIASLLFHPKDLRLQRYITTEDKQLLKSIAYSYSYQTFIIGCERSELLSCDTISVNPKALSKMDSMESLPNSSTSLPQSPLSSKVSNTSFGLLRVSLLDREITQFLPIHNGPVRHICASSEAGDDDCDGEYSLGPCVLSTGDDCKVKYTSLESGQVLLTLDLDAIGTCTAFDPCHPYFIYAASIDGCVSVFDIRKKSRMRSISVPSKSGKSLSIHSMHILKCKCMESSCHKFLFVANEEGIVLIDLDPSGLPFNVKYSDSKLFSNVENDKDSNSNTSNVDNDAFICTAMQLDASNHAWLVSGKNSYHKYCIFGSFERPSCPNDQTLQSLMVNNGNAEQFRNELCIGWKQLYTLKSSDSSCDQMKFSAFATLPSRFLLLSSNSNNMVNIKMLTNPNGISVDDECVDLSVDSPGPISEVCLGLKPGSDCSSPIIAVLSSGSISIYHQ